MGKFAVRMIQMYEEVVIVNDTRITTQEQANRFARKYDREVGMDPQKNIGVKFEAANIHDYPFAMEISYKDLEG
ncbi:hypothetical protein bpr_II136 (plasmid) [Butyrivibrio proteoclasticus B316]|uniref:Uncharacterized protein n=1 Tax=Butyrivibrio proteoclasticus (strain ATCC 51982 / DSM 14932 / B316) TaxID=515622 RepID=E0S3U3_BUTPB|nr:hypothetical protein [Butyrivibrio proteoclasticus]ADL36075.1 hypothetical protein bpr_II136 [Butyrivibrio proteoclasticus B316]